MTYCGECPHFKNEDVLGDGNCDLLRDIMMNCGDECLMEREEAGQ